MKIGVTVQSTDKAMHPVEVAREAEARGFHSLYIPEHTHIPTSRRTPPPAGTEVLPEEYLRSPDPYIALAAAASARTASVASMHNMTLFTLQAISPTWSPTLSQSAASRGGANTSNARTTSSRFFVSSTYARQELFQSLPHGVRARWPRSDRALSVHQPAICVQQLFRNRPGRAVANDVLFHANNGSDARTRGREEHLLAAQHLPDRQRTCIATASTVRCW